ncbi:MAG: CotH kinase family protein, partial [Myxococcales bacterium]|nr:CotH kinase family protein [Myxococcales bacterium]
MSAVERSWAGRLPWALALAVACGDDGGAGDASSSGEALADAGADDGAAGDGDAPAPEGGLFEPYRVLDVEVELAEADWEVLRYEGRKLSTIFTGCADSSFEYTYFPATVTIDGERIENVGVRKKGFLGSLSAYRPSLKINFAKLEPAQRFGEHKRITLNNNRQDRSNTHQCISYRIFRDAGVPAPRCNFARVTLNGEDLGVYSHVESIKRPFLRQHFEDETGHLYEGQGSDFAEGFIERFEFKNDGEPEDRSDLRAVASALERDDGELLSALDAVLPLDRFYPFWATEALVQHWDGYSGDLNNFYVYADPAAGMTFIPWGTDGTFEADHPFLPDDIPSSVYAWGRIANRLYGHTEGQARYREQLGELLDTVWDEAAILEEIDRIEQLSDGLADSAALAEMRARVQARRDEIEDELSGPPPSWDVPPRSPGTCVDFTSEIRATFATSWGDLEEPDFAASNTLEVPSQLAPMGFDAVVARAGTSNEIDDGAPAVRVIGVLPGGGFVLAHIGFGLAPFESGTTPLLG